MTKLTEAEVSEIRRRYAAGGVTYMQLAEKFGVKRQTVYFIVTRVTWQHCD